MNYSSGASVRRPVPELPDNEFSGGPEPREAPGAGKTTLEYLQVLWAKRRMLARVAIGALLSSTLIAFLIPSRYESTARLMPPDSQSSSGLALAAAAMSGAAGGGLGGIAGDLLGLKSTSDVFVGILSSRTVQDKLIQQFDLKKLYSISRMDSARKELAQHTGISVDRKSQIIAITVTDKSPQRAAAMAQAYIDELNRLVAELSTSSARRERIFLEDRLKAVSQDLEAAEKDSSEFASKNTAIDIKEQAKAMVESAAELQGQVIAARSELEGLRQVYADSNVRVRSVRARIDELQHQLEKLGGKSESATPIPDQPGDSLYPSIRKLPLLGVTYADLYRRAMVQEAVFETLTKEYELAKVQEVKETPQIKVLDVANLPDKPTFPPTLSIIFLGTALAFAAGAGWVLLSAFWQETDWNDPLKMFAHEVYLTVSASLPLFSCHRSSAASAGGSFWYRIRSRREDSER